MKRRFVTGLVTTALVLSALPVTALAADPTPVISPKPVIAPNVIAPNPQSDMTRGQFITQLWQLSGKPVVNYLLPFQDVAKDGDQTEAIRWAVSEKIISGVSATSFAPDQAITREQMATMVYHYIQKFDLGFQGTWMFLLPYTDRADISEWAYESVCWLVSSRLCDTEAKEFKPQDPISCADCDVVIAGLKALATEKGVDFTKYGENKG